MRIAVAVLACASILVLGPASGASLERPQTKTTRAVANLAIGIDQRSAPKLRAVDGGPHYYSRFSHPLPSRQSYFPIGVFLECLNSRGDVRRDKEAGLNVYVVICATGQSALNLARANGMRVINEYDWRFAPGPGSETAGHNLGDELDMTMGPAGCAETKRRSQRLPNDGRLRHSNYGKGVLFWQSDAQAACFVNAQDLVSSDTYWFTDNQVCAGSQGGGQPGVVKANNCHAAANYGWQVNRVRNLVSPAGSKPVWTFVEVGHPASENDWPSITPPQIRAAVWHSLIAGARGIIYFNHSFGGPCVSHHALREPCYSAARAMVKSVNAQIKALAPALNAPYATSGWRHSRTTKAMVKWKGGHFYVFAASAGATGAAGSFSIPCVGSATAKVLGEKRAIPVRTGSFTDSFADGNAVHIYRIDGGSACGLKRRF